MDSYTITITPNDDSGNSTTLAVDTSTGQARITSVHMHAPGGLTGGQMPSVDVGLLLQAVTGPTHTPAAITAPSAPVAEAAPQPAPADAGVDEPAATATTATPQSATDDTGTAAISAPTPPARTSRRRAGVRAAEGEPAPSTVGRRGRSQPTAKKATPSKTARKPAKAPAAAAATADSRTERVYRRMPDDFATVYRQAGTTAAIADHYGVPRYTAQGWIGRHRKQDAAANS
jgi:hypothetical protein